MVRVRTEKWWLSAGTEACPVCLHRYVHEMEVRCQACDGPLCPQCAVVSWETHERFCPGCEPGEQPGEEDRPARGSTGGDVA